MTRLRTVSPHDPGWRRVGCGRGFRYLDEDGVPLPASDADRIRGLAIPPAWRDVWICPDERGHLQAVGTDDAGRRQYLYHPDWRVKRDMEKFDRVVSMARKLPGVRRRLRRALKGPPTEEETVLAAAVRLIDLGCFRVGSEEYAETNGSHGLTTLLRRHVGRDGDARVFRFPAKSGVEAEIRVDDKQVVRVVDALARRRRQTSRLLAVRDDNGWRPVDAAQVNEHIRELFHLDVTAKDFRTWHGTVAVALALAEVDRAASTSGRAKQVRTAIREAADLLGNTPAVARSSYVHPRVIDLFESGQVIEPRRGQDALDRAVVRLLD